MSSDIDDIDVSDLEDNATKRVPVCLCLDTSSSMDGEPIDQLNEGVKAFYDAINEDDIARQSADVCIITFGSKNVYVEQDFQSIEGEMPPNFSAGGWTPMGDAINKALDLLESRKQEYKDNAIEYFQPWLVIITDGEPTDNIDRAAQRIRDLAQNNKITVMPIGVENANMGVLKQLSPKNAPKKLKGLNFREFFKWLSASVTKVSHSKPGEKVSLDSTDEWEIS